MGFTIVEVAEHEGVGMLASLLRRYVDEQGWGSEPGHLGEIEALPGEYAQPRGNAFLAVDSESGAPLGCVVMRPLPEWCDDCVEMRRLYVAPEARQQGVARTLVLAADAWARNAGYAAVRLVTLPHMAVAARLYADLGFVTIGAYRPSNAENPIYMEKRLV